VVQIPVPDENDLRHYDEIIMKIKQVEDRLKKTKIRKNITEAVKRDAVKEMSRILNLPLRRFTIEELREKGGVIRDERAFYKSYIQRTNLVNRELIQEMNDELDDLYMARGDLQAMFGLA
jgi:NAD+--asparagine ADP-ribosyltransferase